MRIYSYYCEFPLVEVHPKMCNSAVWIFTKFSEFPHAEIHCSVWIPSWGKVYYLMRMYTRKGEFPKTRKFTKLWFSAYEDLHLQLWISTCGNAPKNAYIRCADIHNFWCITACGDTQFNVNSFTRKSVCARTRICTVLSELTHVEIHKSMCKSAHGEIRFSTCGYSHKFVYFHMRRCTQNWEFSYKVQSNLNVVNTELLREAQVILSISGDCTSRGGHSNGKRGYQARPWAHKKHPNHVFFRYENRPYLCVFACIFLNLSVMSFPKFVYMTQNTPFFPILHVFAPLNPVRAYSAWSWKTTLITWIFGRAWYPPWHSSGPPGCTYKFIIWNTFTLSTLIIVNFHLWKCTQKCVYPLCGFTQFLVYYRMRRYTV